MALPTPNCPETVLTLSTDEARLVIEPYWEAVRDTFVQAGFTRAKKTKLHCQRRLHDTPRHFAACRDDGLAMYVAPEMAELDERMVLAILAHEFGHATDFLYPGEFVLGKDREAMRRVRDEFHDDQWARWMKSWSERDDDLIELTADAIAEYVVGMRIGYVGPCKLQWFERGVPRPIGLR